MLSPAQSGSGAQVWDGQGVQVNQQTNAGTSIVKRNRAEFSRVPRAFRRCLLDRLQAHKREHGTEVLFILKTNEELAALTLWNLYTAHFTETQEQGYQDDKPVQCVDWWREHITCGGIGRGQPPEGQVWAWYVCRFFGVRIGLNRLTEDECQTDWWLDLPRNKREAERRGIERVRGHLLGRLHAHKREHGTEVPFVVASDVECDLLTEGDLVCDGERWVAPVVGRFRNVLISISQAAA